MILKRNYTFCASHRNEQLSGPEFTWHGHNFEVVVSLKIRHPQQLSPEDIDDFMNPIIERLDHSWIISQDDPMYHDVFMADGFKQMNVVALGYVTTPRNICYTIAALIMNLDIMLPENLHEITLSDGRDSHITYDLSDYKIDVENMPEVKTL